MKQSLGRETDIDTGRERLHIKKGSRRHRKKKTKNIKSNKNGKKKEKVRNSTMER